MVNVDNLKVSEEVVNDSEKMKKRLEDINKELNQLNDKEDSNDIVDIKKEYLNSEFADYLIKNKKCDSLKRIVDRLKYGDLNQLGAKAGKGLDDLATFLDDITNKNRMKKDYDEFMDRMQKNPKSLSHMGSREIRRLNLYLGMNPDDALVAYKLMKSKINENWSNDKQDIKFYENIMENLRNNYGKNIKFIEEDYKFLTSLKPNAASLKAILGEKWDGKKETITITKVEDSIVDVNEVIKIVKENNESRINKNINLIVDNLSLDVGNFKFDKSNGSFMVNGQLFNIDKMKEIFGTQIFGKVSSMKIDFLGKDDINQTLDRSYDGIYQKFIKKIDQSLESNRKEDSENKGNGGFDKLDNIKDGLDIGSINNYVISKIGKEKNILRYGEDGYECNIVNVKEFLGKISNNEIKFDKDFIKVGTPSRIAWLSAVQILLNKEYEGTLKVDGQYVKGGETYKAVYNLQKDKFGFNGKDLDGIPGPKTLSKLLGNDDSKNSVKDGKSSVLTEGGNNTNVVVDTNDKGRENGSLKEFTGKIEDLGGYNLQGKKLYKKDGDEKGLYYEDKIDGKNVIIRISMEDPWVKRIVNKPEAGNLLPGIDKMKVELNICNKGAEKLNNIIQNSEVLKEAGFNINFIKGDGEKIYYNLNKGNSDSQALPQNFFTEPFFGEKIIENKFKLINLGIDFSGKENLFYWNEVSGEPQLTMKEDYRIKYGVDLCNNRREEDLKKFCDNYDIRIPELKTYA